MKYQDVELGGHVLVFFLSPRFVHAFSHRAFSSSRNEDLCLPVVKGHGIDGTIQLGVADPSAALVHFPSPEPVAHYGLSDLRGHPWSPRIGLPGMVGDLSVKTDCHNPVNTDRDKRTGVQTCRT